MGVFADGQMGEYEYPYQVLAKPGARLFRPIEVLILFFIEQPVNLMAVVLQDFGVR